MMSRAALLARPPAVSPSLSSASAAPKLCTRPSQRTSEGKGHTTRSGGAGGGDEPIDDNWSWNSARKGVHDILSYAWAPFELRAQWLQTPTEPCSYNISADKGGGQFNLSNNDQDILSCVTHRKSDI